MLDRATLADVKASAACIQALADRHRRIARRLAAGDRAALSDLHRLQIHLQVTVTALDASDKQQDAA